MDQKRPLITPPVFAGPTKIVRQKNVKQEIQILNITTQIPRVNNIYPTVGYIHV